MTEAFVMLLQDGKGTAACLTAKHKALICVESFPMMRCLVDAVVHPTVSSKWKVLAPAWQWPHSSGRCMHGGFF